MYDANNRQPTRLSVEFDSQVIPRINRVNYFALRNVSTWVKLARYIATEFAHQKTTTFERSFSKRQLLDLLKYRIW
jgi:hypothetical protein